MPVTYTQANKILDYNFGKSAYSLPDKYWLALSLQPIEAGDLDCDEPVGNNYARVGIDNAKTDTGFSPSGQGILTNNGTVQFPESTSAWGTVTYVAIFDSPTAGNMLYYDALPESRQIEGQTSLLFSPNTITIQLL